jgi:hypothetical protein
MRRDKHANDVFGACIRAYAAIRAPPTAMASNTKALEIKRAAHKRNGGKKRKKALAKKGTTRSPKELFGSES